MNAEQAASLCLLWHIADTCEEAFFLAKWIQPFSEMTSLNLRHMLHIIVPPPPLPLYQLKDGTLDVLKTVLLQLSFRVPLEMQTFQEDHTTGPYKPLRDGDPLTYAASFVDNETVPVPVLTPIRYTAAWKDLNFFECRELNISMFAHEMEEEAKEGELVGEDEPSL